MALIKKVCFYKGYAIFSCREYYVFNHEGKTISADTVKEAKDEIDKLEMEMGVIA